MLCLKKYHTSQKLIYSFCVKLGEPFDETTPDGREVVATVTCEDGKIVSVQKAKKEGQKSTRVSRAGGLFTMFNHRLFYSR